MKSKKTLVALLLAAELLCGNLSAQSFNIDLGSEYPSPGSAYGAAAGQAGHWNKLGDFGDSLRTLDGLVSNVFLDLTVSGVGFSGPGLTDDERLLGDNLLDCTNPDSWSLEFFGLQPGLYDLFVYAPANTLVSLGPAQASQVGLPDIQGDLLFLQFGTSWTQATVSVSAGSFSIFASASEFDGCVGISGLQLQYRGEAPAPRSAVNIDFGRALGAPTFGYAAAAGQMGAWTPALGGTSSLTDPAGITSPITLTLSPLAASGFSNVIASNRARLTNDSFVVCETQSQWSAMLDGIPSGVYDFYVYAPSNGTVATGDLLIDGIPMASLPGLDGPLQQGVNWNRVTDLTLTNGSLSVTSQGSDCIGLSGAQLVPVNGATDLSVFKSNDVTWVSPGDNVTWEIFVANSGPDTARGVSVVDPIPQAVTNATWACVPITTHASCASGGMTQSGDVAELLDLLAGGVALITVNGIVGSDESIDLRNTVTVTPAAGALDSNPGDNTFTDQDAIGLFADGLELM